MWERRYGFPKPGRDDNGERQYTVADVGKLRAIKRLMDVGMRPGKIIDAVAARAERDGRRADAAAPRRARAGARARRADDAAEPRRDVAAAHAGQPADAAGPAEVRAGDDHAAQSRGRRRLDARRAAGLRGAPVHGAAAGRAAHGDQRVPAADRHSARAADDVSQRAARTRPADGRGDAGARGRAVHLARPADAARGHPPRGGRAQGAHRRAVVLRGVSGAPGERRPGDAAPAAAAAGHAVGRRRDDAARAQDHARRRADSRPGVDHQRAAQLALALRSPPSGARCASAGPARASSVRSD